METFSLTSRINDQSAGTSYLSSLVRGWTVIADAPASSIILATSTALMVFLSQPLLILTVTGIGTCSSDELIIGLYNGLPITIIERAAFKGCTNLVEK